MHYQSNLKKIYFTVTNDLSYDQRMHRICGSLASSGYEVVLVGRRLKNSAPLLNRPYRQKRLHCFFNKGFLFYAEYNLRLFFYLVKQRMHAVCAIDLDTILPCLLVSKIKGVARIYDAHEYFTEMKEVRTRPLVRRVWKLVEKIAVPAYKNGYTVSEGLAAAFKREYRSDYQVIRNVPVLKPIPETGPREKLLLYQGYVNEARGFEYLIPAMQEVPYKLVICGDGNYMKQLKELIAEHGVEQKIELKGMLLPHLLEQETLRASLGITLAEKEGINQFMALPNKFFDYMHAGLPQLAMNFPEYQKINEQHEVAVLINELSPATISATINRVMEDETLLARLRENCLKARLVYNWEAEEKQLLHFYRSVLG